MGVKWLRVMVIPLFDQVANNGRPGFRNDLKGTDCKIYGKWIMLNGISTNHDMLDGTAYDRQIRH